MDNENRDTQLFNAGCEKCRVGKNCTFHYSNGIYRGSGKTKLGYKLKYNIIATDGSRGTLMMNQYDRYKNKVVEIEEKTATCSNCKSFGDSTVFTRMEDTRNENESKNIIICGRNKCQKSDQEILEELYPDELNRIKQRNRRNKI